MILILIGGQVVAKFQPLSGRVVAKVANFGNSIMTTTLSDGEELQPSEIQKLSFNCPNIKAWMCHKYTPLNDIGTFYFPQLEYLRMHRSDCLRSVALYAPKLKTVYLQALYDLETIYLFDNIEEVKDFEKKDLKLSATDHAKNALRLKLPTELVRKIMDFGVERRGGKIEANYR